MFKIRSSASSELDNAIYTINETKEGADNRIIMTRTKKGDGYDWDYVELNVDGKIIKGYIWKDYVQEYIYTGVESVVLDKQALTLEIGESYTLTATINPAESKFKDVKWDVQDKNIVVLVWFGLFMMYVKYCISHILNGYRTGKKLVIRTEVHTSSHKFT